MLTIEEMLAKIQQLKAEAGEMRGRCSEYEHSQEKIVSEN